MVNFNNLISSLILPLVAYPNDFEIVLEESSTQDDLKYKVYVNKADLGRVIGREGHIAKAIRTVLYAGASKEGKRVHLDIDAK